MKNSINVRDIFLYLFYILCLGLILYFVFNLYYSHFGFSISNETIELGVGNSYTVVVDAKNDRYSGNIDYEWKSTNEDIAVVDENGHIVAKNVGNVTIEVKSKKSIFKKKVMINVVSLEIFSISFSDNIVLSVDESLKLNPIINNNSSIKANLFFESVNPSIVSVDSFGNLQALKSGTTLIYATSSNGVRGEVMVTVINSSNNNSSSNSSSNNSSGNSSSNNSSSNNSSNNSSSNSSSNNSSGNSSSNNSSNNSNSSSNKISVSGVKLNLSSGTIYLNSKTKTVKLNASVYPGNATNKNVTWSSSNSSVATVDNNGNVTAINPGTANITVVTLDGGYKATYNLSVRKKVIIVITASQGVRMNDWLKSFTSSKGNSYSISNKTLKYIYKSGSGFDFQVGEGTGKAIDFINNNFKSYKHYVDIYVFFTMTGNSVRLSTCNQITNSSEYNDIANNYNNAINSMKNGGYNIKGHIVSHAPLQSKHPNASAKYIVYSTNSKACSKNYRSGWKYHLSNEKMKTVLKSYPELTFVDNFSNFIIVSDSENRKFTWLRSYTTTDGLHWDESTTIDYMTVLFNDVGM